MGQVTVDLLKARDAYGGWSGLARRLDLTLSTVHGWHRRGNKVPKWRSEQIEKIAKRDKKDVFVVGRCARRKRRTQ